MRTRNWFWHDFKRSFEIYPSARDGSGFTAPVFLYDHYHSFRHQRSRSRRVLDYFVAKGFRVWVRRRAKKTRRKYDLNSEWERRARSIASTCFADPAEIALFRINSEADCAPYLRKFEHAAINRRINPAGWRADCVLRDKLKFRRLVAEAGGTVPLLVASCENGRIATTSAPAPKEIAVKPNDAGNGVGFSIINLADENRKGASLAGVLAAKVGSRVNWVAEERLQNHKALRSIALNALATVRLISVIDEDGQAEIVSAILRFALDPSRLVDNRGGAAGIHLTTGQLFGGCIGKAVGDFSQHPETGAEINAITIPDWNRLKSEAVRLHDAVFGNYTIIGWDIAPTAKGAVFVEGNNLPCSTLAQRPLRAPIGHQRYGELIAHHLAKASN